MHYMQMLVNLFYLKDNGIWGGSCELFKAERSACRATAFVLRNTTKVA
jgi:hypothetical protein